MIEQYGEDFTDEHRFQIPDGCHWDDIEVRLKGERIRCGGNGMAAIVRTTLLHLLQERAVALGADLRFSTEVTLDDLGETARCHLAFFTDRQLKRINSSEGRRYELCRLGGLRLDWNGAELEEQPLAYLATAGVLCLGGEPVLLGDFDQLSLFERIAAELGPAAGLPAAEQFFSEPGSYYRVLQGELRAAGLWRPHRLAAEPASL